MIIEKVYYKKKNNKNLKNKMYFIFISLVHFLKKKILVYIF